MRQLSLQAFAFSLALIGFGPAVGAQTPQGVQSGASTGAHSCDKGADLCQRKPAAEGKAQGKQAGDKATKQEAKPAGKASKIGQKAGGKDNGSSGGGDQSQRKGQNLRKAEKQSATSAADRGPRVGDSAKGAQEFQRSAQSRLGAAPEGQSYRVVDKHLVLVDKKNLKVVKVLGLLDELVN